MLLDINGDGLPDKVDDNGRVYKLIRVLTLSSSANYTGCKLDETEGQSINLSATGYQNSNIYTAVPFCLIFIGTIEISGGGGATLDGNSTTYALRDINGDGLPDLVFRAITSCMHAVTVRENQHAEGNQKHHSREHTA
jgi:hypothetical protein